MNEANDKPEQEPSVSLVNGTHWIQALAQGSVTSSTLYFFISSNSFLFFIGLIGHVAVSWMIARDVKLATSDETKPPKHALHNLLMLIIFAVSFLLPVFIEPSPLVIELWTSIMFVLITLSNRYLIKTVYAG
mgnify:FL=1